MSLYDILRDEECQRKEREKIEEKKKKDELRGLLLGYSCHGAKTNETSRLRQGENNFDELRAVGARSLLPR